MHRPIIATIFLMGLWLAMPVEAAKAPNTPINLNSADITELMQLPGVGAIRAEAIVKYRAAHSFQRPTDLMRVKGFGRKIFQRLRPFVVVVTAGSASVAPNKATGAAIPTAAHITEHSEASTPSPD